MSLLRRRRLSPELAEVHAHFLSAVEPVEAAKQALVGAVPQARFPGRELSDALAAFDRSLAEAQSRMDPWRHPDLEAEWVACTRGLVRARTEAAVEIERLGSGEKERVGSSEVGFESLLELVQSYLDPLEPFAQAEERFHALRTR